MHKYSFLVPGQGVPCGSNTCHPYADCYQTFGGDDSSAQCRCTPGLKGDGVEDCRPVEADGTVLCTNYARISMHGIRVKVSW